jgi:phytoene dehydrogenase-like protein
MHFDVVIVGAGLSGLAAGLRSALYDRRVLIVEQHWLWGGLNSFYKKGGVLFDVGLHALTNYLPPGGQRRPGPRPPLHRLCRSLRLRFEELDLVPQSRSSIRLDELSLPLTNRFEDLLDAVRLRWPTEVDGLRRLATDAHYPDAIEDRPFVSTRERLEGYLKEPLLREMILLPIFFYGNASEDDMDWGDFGILFQSIFLEGLGRPRDGMRTFLGLLRRRYLEAGGQLWCRSPVVRLTDGPPVRIDIEGRSTITADVVLSSAGRVETDRLLGHGGDGPERRLAFIESAWVLDRDPSSWGYEDCVTFYSRGPRVRWRVPDSDVDLSSGVLCCPNHYVDITQPEQPILRSTHLARADRWIGIPETEYAERKADATDRIRREVEHWTGPFSDHVTQTDAFTPRTVVHYTGHDGGAIYGSPKKSRNGATQSPRVHLIGTDQGMVGIVGAMASGVSMANSKVLAS